MVLMNTQENKKEDAGGEFKHLKDKVQRLTKAVYRVTDLYTDREPLKWTLRNNALSLHTKLSTIIKEISNPSVKEELSNNHVVSFRELDEIMDLINRVVDLLGVASASTFVSGFNFEILEREYLSLGSFLEGRKNVLDTDLNLLIVGGVEIESDSNNRQLSSKPITEKDWGRAKQASNQVSGKYPNDLNKATSDLKNIRNTKKNTLNKPILNVGNRGNDRKDKIVKFLNQNGKRTISEISALFGNVSEKTTQRDLFDLTRSGKVIADGEKRWRTYSLTKNVS